MTATYFAPSSNDFEILIPQSFVPTIATQPLNIPIDLTTHWTYEIDFRFLCTSNTYQFFTFQVMASGFPTSYGAMYAQHSNVGGFFSISTGLVNTSNLLPVGGNATPYTMPAMGKMIIKPYFMSVQNGMQIEIRSTLANPNIPTVSYDTWTLINLYGTGHDQIRITPNGGNWDSSSTYSMVAWDKQ